MWEKVALTWDTMPSLACVGSLRRVPRNEGTDFCTGLCSGFFQNDRHPSLFVLYPTVPTSLTFQVAEQRRVQKVKKSTFSS